MVNNTLKLLLLLIIFSGTVSSINYKIIKTYFFDKKKYDIYFINIGIIDNLFSYKMEYKYLYQFFI